MIGEDKFVVVEAVELWETRRGFSKPCGKAALSKGWLSIGRQIHSPGSPRPRVDVINERGQIQESLAELMLAVGPNAQLVVVVESKRSRVGIEPWRARR